jgi:hypothetical protein
VQGKKLDKTLVVFEFRDEVDCFISHRSIDELRDENVHVLALMPETQTYLKNMDIRFFNSYHLFGAEGHRKALLQSDRIYNFCEPFLTIEDDIGIKEGYRNFFLFSLRLYVHYLLWLIEVIKNACRQWNIKKIVCFDRDDRHAAEPFLSTAEGHAGKIGEAVAKQLDIAFEHFHMPNAVKNPLFNKLKIYAVRFIKFFIYQMKCRFLIPRMIGGKKIILTTIRAYNLGRVLDRFKQAFDNAHIIYLNSGKKGLLQKFLDAVFSVEILPLPTIGKFTRKNIFCNKLHDLITNLETSDGIIDAFTYRMVSLKELAFKKIRKDIIPALCDIYSQSIYLNNFLRKFNPVLIISQMARGINYNLGELAGLCRIPSLLISHGSHIPPENEYEMIEWQEHGLGLINTPYRYVALQSPLAKAYTDKITIRSTPIITGPLLFANISRHGDNGKERLLTTKNIFGYKDKIILLHADTPRLRGTFRFYVYQTVDEYIAGLNLLINAVERVKGFHLLIRFRPQYYLSEEHLKSLLIKSDCYSIHSDGAFEDYLSAADMLISYSSTTIEEALQNKVPVMLFDPHGKYSHIKGSQVLDLNQPVKIDSCYYIGREADLADLLRWLKENHFSVKEPYFEWDKYIFKNGAKVELTSYFKHLFQ